MPYVPRRLRHDPAWHVWGLATGLLFAVMLMIARLHAAELNAFDSSISGALFPYQTFGAIEIFLVITAFGGAAGIAAVTVGAALLLRRNSRSVLELAFLMLCASTSMKIAKTFVERARPHTLTWIDPLNTYSFPSGHATLTTALYGFIAVCLYRRIRDPIIRNVSVSACIFVIVAVDASRVVLNAHYLSDVIAGTLLGLFWLSVTFMLPRGR